jgi:hypothetical protein
MKKDVEKKRKTIEIVPVDREALHEVVGGAGPIKPSAREWGWWVVAPGGGTDAT